jgi:hypothetical protein
MSTKSFISQIYEYVLRRHLHLHLSCVVLCSRGQELHLHAMLESSGYASEETAPCSFLRHRFQLLPRCVCAPTLLKRALLIVFVRRF